MSQLPTDLDYHRAQKIMGAWGRAYSQGAPPAQILPPVAPIAAIAPSRGEADVQAAWQRWHNPSVEARFSKAEWVWYATLERARVEALASQHLPGIARNLSPLETLSPVNPAMACLYQTARQIFGGQADIAIGLAEQMGPSQTTPQSHWLGLRWPWQPLARPDSLPALWNDIKIAEALRSASLLVQDGTRFAEVLHPLITNLANHYGADLPRSPAQSPIPTDDSATPEGGSASDEEHPDAKSERSGSPREPNPAVDSFPGYGVFSPEWDEVLPAAHWYQPEDAEALRALNHPDRRQMRQLAHRLQRRLLASRLRHWSFDHDEGRLDNRRLARLVGHNPSHYVFRVEDEAPVPEACVILLVDQSGSMRGTAQRLAVLAIDLMVHTLELCQVRCEVLGYTTRFGADNPIRQRWQQLDCPSAPGRLNALRHIVYKTTEQPWRRARPQLGLLLRQGFGHENIDGEALYWAARRLMMRPQARKLLVVLSDGAPYDEATAQANGRSFLENHLRAVITEVEASPIQLIAIGTGQDVGRYYRQAVTVRRPDAIAEVLFERLGDFLTQPYPRAHTL